MTSFLDLQRRFPSRFALWAGMVAALLAAGCGADTSGDLGRVEGTVTLDGAPYPNAMVVFTPAKGRPSKGVTDDQGRYELIYLRDTRGAEPGEHKVLITTIPPSQPDTYTGPPPKEPLPPRYNRKSELVETVELGKNVIDFELKSS